MKKLGLSLIMLASLIGCDSNTNDILKIQNSNDIPNTLSANDWSLTEYGENAETMSFVIPETHYELRFAKDTSNVSGTVDCNSFESTYSASDDDLSIDYIELTEMFCLYAANASIDELQQYTDQNAFITLALSTIDNFLIEEDTLTIHSVGGEILLYQLKDNE